MERCGSGEMVELTSSSNTNRPLDPPNLGLLQITRMRNKPQIQPPLLQKPRHILTSKTIPQTTHLLDSKIRLHSRQSGRDDAIDFTWRVLREPAGQIEPGFLLLHGDGVAGEEVGHHDEVVVGGEGVGEEFVLEERDAEDVGDVKEGAGGGVGVGRVGDVHFNFGCS